MNNSPIGVFDSGLGGVSVLHEIRRQLPHEDLLYCADSGYAPYGTRSAQYVCERSALLCEFLLNQGCKAIVIACNTATAAAAKMLRERWPNTPIIGMEPAVKPATQATQRKVVGVLATAGTLSSTRFAALLDNFGHGVKVVTQPGTGLVECVERGQLHAPATRALLAQHLQPLLAAGADVIVLGCTHYVFLREMTQELVGEKVRVIDTGAAVAAHLAHRLSDLNLHTARTASGAERFWTSGDVLASQQTLRGLWPQAISIQALPTA